MARIGAWSKPSTKIACQALPHPHRSSPAPPKSPACQEVIPFTGPECPCAWLREGKNGPFGGACKQPRVPPWPFGCSPFLPALCPPFLSVSLSCPPQHCCSTSSNCPLRPPTPVHSFIRHSTSPFLFTTSPGNFCSPPDLRTRLPTPCQTRRRPALRARCSALSSNSNLFPPPTPNPRSKSSRNPLFIHRSTSCTWKYHLCAVKNNSADNTSTVHGFP